MLNDRADQIHNEMRLIQSSANEDTKSSMGDKYETSRAMAMIEKENLAGQLKVVQDQIRVLKEINNLLASDTIQLGSLIHMDDGSQFYISVSLGKIQLNDSTYFLISPVSPLGKALINQKRGSEITVVGRKLTIEEIM